MCDLDKLEVIAKTLQEYITCERMVEWNVDNNVKGIFHDDAYTMIVKNSPVREEIYKILTLVTEQET